MSPFMGIYPDIYLDIQRAMGLWTGTTATLANKIAPVDQQRLPTSGVAAEAIVAWCSYVTLNLQACCVASVKVFKFIGTRAEANMYAM